MSSPTLSLEEQLAILKYEQEKADRERAHTLEVWKFIFGVISTTLTGATSLVLTIKGRKNENTYPPRHYENYRGNQKVY
jgi:hypothetical protein